MSIMVGIIVKIKLNIFYLYYMSYRKIKINLKNFSDPLYKWNLFVNIIKYSWLTDLILSSSMAEQPAVNR